MNKRIILEVEKLVRKTCGKKSNPFGESAMKFHIDSVVKYARMLAKKLRVDEEVVTIAAYLHDFASISDKDLYAEHHIHGARLATKILKKYHYPKEKIEAVKHCILTHRASRAIPRKTAEAKIVASADAMAHFDRLNGLFYVAFITFKMGVDEGTRWVLGKLERNYKKLLPEGKKMVKNKYEAIKKVLGEENYES
jgi:uncharacterized protein